MEKEDKYYYSKIAAKMIASVYSGCDNLRMTAAYNFIDLEKEKDRMFLKVSIEDVIDVFDKALKELEVEDNERNREDGE